MDVLPLVRSQREGELFLAQNWDWLEELHNGMILLDIKPANSDVRFKFLSEAGFVGKIGMNSTGSGFGFCMNAFRSGAFNQNNFPVHVMSRRLLQYATDFDSAIAIIENVGVASTINYMLGDKAKNHADIECSPQGNVLISPHHGYVVHTNHLYGSNRPPKLVDNPAANSMARLARMKKLTGADKQLEVPTRFASLRGGNAILDM